MLHTDPVNMPDMLLADLFDVLLVGKDIVTHDDHMLTMLIVTISSHQQRLSKDICDRPLDLSVSHMRDALIYSGPARIDNTASVASKIHCSLFTSSHRHDTIQHGWLKHNLLEDQAP